MMPTIRVEDDVFQGLKSLAEPFTDTPNTVIRRLLEERGALQPKKAEVAPPPDGGTGDGDNGKAPSLTPQSTYEAYLLYILGKKYNGRGGKHEVTKSVINFMNARGLIGRADLERVTTGETKAENTIAWARNALKEKGLISRISPRGIWELTPTGLEKSKVTYLPKSKT
jgi:hypothetical protein